MTSSTPKFSQSRQVSLGVGRGPSSEQRSGKRALDGDNSRPLKNSLSGADSDSDDSEDDQPLSCEVSVFSKGSTENTLAKDSNKSCNFFPTNKYIHPKESMITQPVKSENDLDDDVPLRIWFQVKQLKKPLSEGSLWVVLIPRMRNLMDSFLMNRYHQIKVSLWTMKTLKIRVLYH